MSNPFNPFQTRSALRFPPGAPRDVFEAFQAFLKIGKV